MHKQWPPAQKKPTTFPRATALRGQLGTCIIKTVTVDVCDPSVPAHQLARAGGSTSFVHVSESVDISAPGPRT